MNYSDDVEAIAEYILQEVGLDEEEWYDAIHTEVDASRWIIYENNHEEVLNNTDNEPDTSDVRGMLSDRDLGDWRVVRQTAAYIAMEEDVRSALYNLAENYFECVDCSEVKNKDDECEHSVGSLCPACHKSRFKCDIGKDAEGNAVIYHSHDDNEAEKYKLEGNAALLVDTVIKGITPIGVLLDCLEEQDKEFITECVDYLRGQYPKGNEQWKRESFLSYESEEQVRED